MQFMGHKFVAIFITPRTAVRCAVNFDRTQQLLHNHLPCALLDNLTSLRRVLLPQLDGPMPAFGTSLALQLLKKGTTGLIVGNARGNLCLISGDMRFTHAGTCKKNLMVVLAVYGPPIVGAQSHLAVEKVP